MDSVEQPQEISPGGTLEILAALSKRLLIPDFRIKVMPENHDLSNRHGWEWYIRLGTPQPCPTWKKGGAFDALCDRDNPVRIWRDLLKFIEEQVNRMAFLHTRSS
jgi:hypothetical protein